jgi:acrylyl-CoA reductase (NADPH)
MPFILRGISLLGIDSVACPHGLRTELWQRLASDMHPKHLEDIVDRTVSLEELPEAFERMLHGESHGRTVVSIGGW